MFLDVHRAFMCVKYSPLPGFVSWIRLFFTFSNQWILISGAYWWPSQCVYLLASHYKDSDQDAKDEVIKILPFPYYFTGLMELHFSATCYRRQIQMHNSFLNTVYCIHDETKERNRYTKTHDTRVERWCVWSYKRTLHALSPRQLCFGSPKIPLTAFTEWSSERSEKKCNTYCTYKI